MSNPHHSSSNATEIARSITSSRKRTAKTLPNYLYTVNCTQPLTTPHNTLPLASTNLPRSFQNNAQCHNRGCKPGPGLIRIIDSLPQHTQSTPPPTRSTPPSLRPSANYGPDSGYARKAATNLATCNLRTPKEKPKPRSDDFLHMSNEIHSRSRAAAAWPLSWAAPRMWAYPKAGHRGTCWCRAGEGGRAGVNQEAGALGGGGRIEEAGRHDGGVSSYPVRVTEQWETVGASRQLGRHLIRLHMASPAGLRGSCAHSSFSLSLSAGGPFCLHRVCNSPPNLPRFRRASSPVPFLFPAFLFPVPVPAGSLPPFLTVPLVFRGVSTRVPLATASCLICSRPGVRSRVRWSGHRDSISSGPFAAGGRKLEWWYSNEFSPHIHLNSLLTLSLPPFLLPGYECALTVLFSFSSLILSLFLFGM